MAGKTLIKPTKENMFVKKENVNQALAGMKGGESREGFLGTGNIVHKPDYVVSEDLSGEDAGRKKLFQQILTATIEPNNLSIKSSPEMDRRSMVTKLNKSTFNELKRLLPERVLGMTVDQLKEIVAETVELTDGEKAEIQEKYRDLSP